MSQRGLIRALKDRDQDFARIQELAGKATGRNPEMQPTAAILEAHGIAIAARKAIARDIEEQRPR